MNYQNLLFFIKNEYNLNKNSINFLEKNYLTKDNLEKINNILNAFINNKKYNDPKEFDVLKEAILITLNIKQYTTLLNIIEKNEKFLIFLKNYKMLQNIILFENFLINSINEYIDYLKNFLKD